MYTLLTRPTLQLRLGEHLLCCVDTNLSLKINDAQACSCGTSMGANAVLGDRPICWVGVGAMWLGACMQDAVPAHLCNILLVHQELATACIRSSAQPRSIENMPTVALACVQTLHARLFLASATAWRLPVLRSLSCRP